MEKYEKSDLEEFLNQSFDQKGHELWLNGDSEFWKGVYDTYISDENLKKSVYISWKKFVLDIVNKSFTEINVKKNGKSSGSTIFISQDTTNGQMLDYALNQLNASDFDRNGVEWKININYPISDDNNFIDVNFPKTKTKRKTATKPKVVNENIDLDDYFGKIFVNINTHSQPEIVRIVGWTKNAIKKDARIRNVYVETIPLITKNHKDGGNAEIDHDWLNSNTIDKPVFNNKDHSYESYIIKMQDDQKPYLSHKGVEFHMEDNDNNVYTWVEY